MTTAANIEPEQTIPFMETTAPAWTDVESALLKHHHNPDLLAARALYAGVAAHRLTGTPVWTMLVAPPGSMKTELLNGLNGLPHVHFVDQLTPQTFLSGQIPDPEKPSKVPASLLHRIGKQGVIVVPDFSTMLAGNADKRGAIFSDMRRIYDGRLRKEFGTDDAEAQREWTGRLTIVVAVTPEIDRYASVFQSLGERFVMVRWPRSGGLETALAAMNQDNKEAKRELNEAVARLMRSLPAVEPTIPRASQVEIANMAELAVIARTAVVRSGPEKSITELPEPESATRLVQQLAQLSKGSALLDGREQVSPEDVRLVRRVAFDCMPPARSRVLKGLFARLDRREMGLPPSTLHYVVEDLEALGLVESGWLSDRGCELMTNAVVAGGYVM